MSQAIVESSQSAQGRARAREVDNEVEAHIMELSSTVERIRDDRDYYGDVTVENLGFVIRDARNLRNIIRRERLVVAERAGKRAGAAVEDEVIEPILVEIREAVDFLCMNDDNGDAIGCCAEMIEQIEKLSKILRDVDASAGAGAAGDKKRKHAAADADA